MGPVARRIGVGVGARLAGLTLLGTMLVVASLASPAGANPVVQTPPGAAAVTNGGWIAFSLSGTTSGSTVTLSPDTGTPPVTPTDLWPGGNWPSQWSAGGITLNLVGPGPCTIAANPNQSCEYTLSGSTQSGSPVVFGEGTFPNPSAPPDEISVAAPPPPTTSPPSIPPATPSTNFTGPPNGLLTGPGQFTFTAPGQFGVAYTWTLINTTTGQSYQGSGTTYTPPPSIFGTAGQYTLTLTATEPGHPTGTSTPISFEISPSAPGPSPSPSPGPGPSPTPAAPAPAASAPALTHLSTVSYVPLSNFDTPTPAAIRPVTVIWLWRPDWFQTAEAARTAGRPSGVKRASVSIDAKGTAGPSATPWLAGLATFGIFGFAWILVRRRRVRTSILD